MSLLFALWLGVAPARAARFLVTPRSPRDLDELARTWAGARALPHVGLLVVDAPTIEMLRADPRVRDVEPDHAHERPARTGATALTPAEAWGLAAVRAPAAWAVTRGGGARVMILDTGVDFEHPALRPHLERARNFVGDRPDDYFDRDGHGTHVTGTVVGVAPDARVLAGRICGGGACSAAAIASGLDWAIEERVDVVNLSIAGDTLTRAEVLALTRTERAGVAVVAAAGNDGVGLLAYPAAFDTVLAVGAMNRRRLVPRFSQWGPQLAVVAPGTDVYAALPRGTGRAAEVRLDGGAVIARALPGSALGDVDGELVDVGPGGVDDFIAHDVNARVALVTRGPAFFREMIAFARLHGARAVLIANGDDGTLVAPTGTREWPASIPVAVVGERPVAAARARLTLGHRVRARLTITAADYGYMRGSSMAAPFVAGILALVRAVAQEMSPPRMRDLVRRTARPIESSVNARSGRGLVDAGGAVTAAKGENLR